MSRGRPGCRRGRTRRAAILVATTVAVSTSPGCRTRPHQPASGGGPGPLTSRIDPAPGVVERVVEGAEGAPVTVSYTQGGLRGSRRGDEVRLADDGFLRPIAQAVRTDHGWVFVATDGATARSDSFLGRLTPTAPIDPVSAAMRGAGRAAIVDVRGRLMTTDGRAPWSPVELPLPAWQAVFCSATHGAAVVVGGDIYQTHDGGATWRFVLNSRGIGGLACDGDAIVPLLPSLSLRLTERDAFEPRPPPTTAPTDHGRTRSGEVAWRVFQRNAGQALWLSGELPDGAWLAHDGDWLREVDRETRRERRRVRAPVSFSPHHIALTGWEITFHLDRGGSGPGRSIQVDLRPPAEAGSYEVYSVDGRTGASLDRASAGRNTLVRGPVPGPPAPVVLDGPMDHLEALDDRHAWGTTFVQDSPHPVSVDLASGHVEPRRRPGSSRRRSRERVLRTVLVRLAPTPPDTAHLPTSEHASGGVGARSQAWHDSAVSP